MSAHVLVTRLSPFLLEVTEDADDRPWRVSRGCWRRRKEAERAAESLRLKIAAVTALLAPASPETETTDGKDATK